MGQADPEAAVAWLRATIAWSPVYRPEWDGEPAAYRRSGAVGGGRSRRLGRLALSSRGVLAYAGVHDVEPAHWGLAGRPETRFFVSCRVGGHVWLRSFPTLDEGLAALAEAAGLLDR